MRLQEKLDQQRVNSWPVTIDPVILCGMAFGRTRDDERASPASASCSPTAAPDAACRSARRMLLVFAQLVVVIEVLVAQHQAKDPPSHFSVSTWCST